MNPNNQNIGKIIYALTFLVLFPAGLWFWAKFTGQIILLPAIESKIAGGILMVVGGSLMLWAMFALQYYGKGLPMNAYPPPVFVTQGPYRLFRHPIYWGFGLLMIGYFVYSGSASGLWLVSPLTVMGMVALVLGHESIDLKRRFPDQFIRTVLDYPEDKTDSADFRDRLTSLFWVGSYLVLSNFMIEKLNGTVLPFFGEPLRIIPALENPYLPFLSLIFFIATPFFLKRKDVLREWELSGFIALSYSAFIAFLYPEIGAQYFPSQGPVLFAVPVFLLFISLKALFRQSVKMAIVFAVIASILVVIQLINSRSAILHLASSILIFLLSGYYLKIWIFLKNLAEKIANSWKEWVFGKVRVINHGFYVGSGAFLGVLLAGILAGREYALALLVFTLIVNICAALWAQIIEGSAKLKRPFGYYGGIVGIVFGSFAVWIMGLNIWVVIGVASVVMPWVQAIGRLRCLVNGCCHGRKSDNPLIGIRYFHPRSRVCNISGLKGELVHPTQLYAILWLSGVGILLLTLWNNGCSSPFIFGLYLILTSLGRFVEEAFRGEVQTPILGGLHLYQWTAIIALIIGIILTTIQVEPIPINSGFSWESVLVAFVSGLFVFFAMGVDFPYSNARFSRLV
ncbi:MAG: prolipoprotein diacylglyceryl transferase [Prolixibacteraceae bacterium]|nr:prolipoprotein diacylglyceryl transferase [Prolixibacteraceae bacterium]